METVTVERDLLATVVHLAEQRLARMRGTIEAIEAMESVSSIGNDTAMDGLRDMERDVAIVKARLNAATPAPTPPEGYELLPKGDGHTVQEGEITWFPREWRVSTCVGHTVPNDMYYCRPIEQEEPDPDVPAPPEGYKLLPKGDGHVVREGELACFYRGWFSSIKVGHPAPNDLYYCRPIK